MEEANRTYTDTQTDTETETETEDTLTNIKHDKNSHDTSTDHATDTETEDSFVLSQYELVGESASDLEDDGEGKEEQDTQETQCVLETQYPYQGSSTPAHPAPVPSPSVDIAGYFLASQQPEEIDDEEPKEEEGGDVSEESGPQPEEDDQEEVSILEELMFGTERKKRRKEPHCKTCTCYKS